MKETSQSNRIPSLDGIRGIAIIFVLFSHAIKSTKIFSNNPNLESIIISFGGYVGGLGVNIFLVISGYLITYLLRKEIEKYGNIDFKKFYLRRSIRIFPSFYLYLGIIFLLSYFEVLKIPIINIASSGMFVWNYSFLWSDISGQDLWFLGHTWSLSLEEQFYLFWPATLVFLGRKKSICLAMILILLSPVLRVISYLLFPNIRGYIGIMTHTHIDVIMFGCVIALAEGLPKFEYLAKKLSTQNTALLCSAFLLFVSPLFYIKFRGLYALPIGFTTESIAITVVILWLIRNHNTTTGKFFNSKLIVHFGFLSYSLYLWQQLFLTELNTTWLGIFPANLIFCYITAELSYRFIEQPFLKLRRFFKRSESV
jgi:peptidoglycan/LPS O-acetylase OafA/YrhL